MQKTTSGFVLRTYRFSSQGTKILRVITLLFFVREPDPEGPDLATRFPRNDDGDPGQVHGRKR